MQRSQTEAPRSRATRALTCLIIAMLVWSATGCVHAEGDETPELDSSGLISRPAFASISLDDLKAAESLTVIQDSDGPVVRMFKVCRSVKGYSDFDPNPTHEFSRSLLGRAWLYAEIGEIETARSDKGTYKLSLSADILVSSEDGNVIWRKDRAYSFSQELASPAYGVFAYAYVPTIFLGKGEYNVQITIHDHIGGKQSRVNTLVRIR